MPANRTGPARKPLRERLARQAVPAALVLALLIALAPAWHRPESTFDEGFTLAYGARVLEGDLPHRDFLSFYGPANPVLVAGTFAIGGARQESERVLGVLYRLLVVLALTAVVAATGRLGALAVGCAAIVLLLPMGVPAMASLGALGCGLASLALLGGGRRGGWVAAGALAGLAGLLRPDFGVAVVLGWVPLILGRDRQKLRPALAGAVPAVLLAGVHVAAVGTDVGGRLVRELRQSGPGRRLPFDPSSDVAAFAEASRILLLVVAGILCALVVAVLRRDRPQAPTAAALALLAAGLLPYTLSRLDYTHAVVALVPAVGAMAVAAYLVLPRPVVTAAAAAALVTLALILAPQVLQSFARLHTNQLLGRAPWPEWVPAGSGGRTFGLAAPLARDIQHIVDAAQLERSRGARTLFVGPRDLRRGYQNDAFLYFVLPGLEPASYYMEINPWTANRPGSKLAEELREADLLILNRYWDTIEEPNEAQRYGSEEPNLVVSKHFCVVTAAGTYELLRRCR